LTDAFNSFISADTWYNKLIKLVVGEDTYKKALDILAKGANLKMLSTNGLTIILAIPFSGFFKGLWDR
jgi:hypothetical protein